MKTKTILLLALSSAITLTSIAQPPPSPGGPRGRGAPPLPQNTEQINGVVSQYLMNPNGEVDGLLLSDNTQIKFPPHMSADLTRVVKPNDRITASGERESAQAFHAFTITNTASGQSVVESRPSQFPPRLPPDLRGVNLAPLNASGRIKALLHAPRGEIDGAVLEDGTILHVRPDVGAQYASSLGIGQTVSAQGFGTQNTFGRSLEVTELGVAGQALTPLYSPAAGATSSAVPPPSPPQGPPPPL
jgi:hypothetical protein